MQIAHGKPLAHIVQGTCHQGMAISREFLRLNSKFSFAYFPRLSVANYIVFLESSNEIQHSLHEAKPKV